MLYKFDLQPLLDFHKLIINQVSWLYWVAYSYTRSKEKDMLQIMNEQAGTILKFWETLYSTLIYNIDKSYGLMNC